MEQSTCNADNFAANMEREKKTFRQARSLVEELTDDIASKASNEDDMKNCFDLNLLLSGKRVGVRIRDTKYLPYADEITIRCKVVKNPLTEWDKVMAGKAPDFYLYGFARPDHQIIAYSWVNMRLLAELLKADQSGATEMRNTDGTRFKAISLEQYQPAVIKPITYLWISGGL